MRSPADGSSPISIGGAIGPEAHTRMVAFSQHLHGIADPDDAIRFRGLQLPTIGRDRDSSDGFQRRSASELDGGDWIGMLRYIPVLRPSLPVQPSSSGS